MDIKNIEKGRTLMDPNTSHLFSLRFQWCRRYWFPLLCFYYNQMVAFFSLQIRICFFGGRLWYRGR